MSLDGWADLATILQAVFLPISLFFVWYQLRRQSSLTQAANTQSLVEISSPFNLQLIHDRDFAALWVKGAAAFDGMDEVDKYRFKSLLVWWLLFHENIFYQKQRGFIDEVTYKAWAHDLQDFVLMMDLGRHWPAIRGFCQDKFVAHVDGLIEEVGKQSASV